MGTNELKLCTVRRKIFYTGPTRAGKAGQKSFVPASQAQRTEPTEEGRFSYVLFDSPFTSVSTVSRGHHSLVSLIVTIDHTYSINNPCLQDVDGAERITRFTMLYGGAQSRDTRVNKQIDVFASQVYSPPLYCTYKQ
jgi:hypothetical protein